MTLAIENNIHNPHFHILVFKMKVFLFAFFRNEMNFSRVKILTALMAIVFIQILNFYVDTNIHNQNIMIFDKPTYSKEL